MSKTALALSLVVLFATASCGDDEDQPKVLDGSADAAGDVGVTMCTGTFSVLNRAQLGAVTMPAGKCSSASDLDLICTTNIRGLAGACGKGCAGMPASCTDMCLKPMVALSDACLGCYTAAVLCAQNMCFAECVADPAAPGCTACQAQKGCLTAFFGCSGLPSGAPPSDGGTPDGAGSPDALAGDAVAGDAVAGDASEGDAPAGGDTGAAMPDAGSADDGAAGN
jgi:hypothetical protein